MSTGSRREGREKTASCSGLWLETKWQEGQRGAAGTTEQKPIWHSSGPPLSPLLLAIPYLLRP